MPYNERAAMRNTDVYARPWHRQNPYAAANFIDSEETNFRNATSKTWVKTMICYRGVNW